MFRLFTFVIVAAAFICIIESVDLKSDATDSINKTCKPVDCKGKIKKCPYGYEKTKDGCEICKCHDPCNPSGKAILCGSNKRCFVDLKPNGTFVTRCGLPESKSNKDICKQEKLSGMCTAAFRRFYYNTITKKCELFIYGGCGGNSNNFDTKKECKAACEV